MTATTDNARVINLDQSKSARAESEPVKVIFKGAEYTLPSELPFEFADAARREEAKQALDILLGDQADDFFAARPSVDDIATFTEAIVEVYGLDTGKSEPSPMS
jgi:hypothetical protein